MDIASIVAQCKKTRRPYERDASFDYCFNYFQEFREAGSISQLANPQRIQLSCLQIGFFLASWGMLRGASFLLQKSVKFYEQLISGIAAFDERIWTIDLDTYSQESIRLLLECQKMITKAFSPYSPSDTLATKIMLGVFGNVPAFDTNFCTWMKSMGFSQRFSSESLSDIATFYQSRKIQIDAVSEFTLDYSTGLPTHRKYPKARIVDMIGYVEGENALSKKASA